MIESRGKMIMMNGVDSVESVNCQVIRVVWRICNLNAANYATLTPVKL